MRKKLLLLCALLTTLVHGCVLMQAGAPPELTDEQERYLKIMTAFKNRAFESCVTASQQCLSTYPDSPRRDVVMIRMGEAFEGLLDQHYHEQIKEGAEEAEARSLFLDKFGHYDCWEERDGDLVYDKRAFRKLLEESPESNYADEATYNLIIWERDYNNDPLLIEREIKELENVITLYPTTTLAPQILFKIGYRHHLLYELYHGAPEQNLRNDAKAQEAYNRAEYSYRLCMNASGGTAYAKQAFQFLEKLKNGERIPLEGD